MVTARTLVGSLLLFASSFALARPADAGTTPVVDGKRSPVEPAAPTMLRIAARAGYALPFGQWTGNIGTERSGLLNEVYTAIYPLQLEATYRFAEWVSAGAYGQFAPAALSYRCTGGSCSARNVRAGVLLVLRLDWEQSWSPYIVPELGYTSSDFSAEAEDGSYRMEVSYRGFDATVTVGADYPVLPRFRVGFFFFARGGTYLWRAVTQLREGFEVIPKPSAHGFLGFGIRGEYAIF